MVVGLMILQSCLNEGKGYAVSQNDNWPDERKINNLLGQYKLQGNNILHSYILPYRNE